MCYDTCTRTRCYISVIDLGFQTHVVFVRNEHYEHDKYNVRLYTIIDGHTSVYSYLCLILSQPNTNTKFFTKWKVFDLSIIFALLDGFFDVSFLFDLFYTAAIAQSVFVAFSSDRLYTPTRTTQTSQLMRWVLFFTKFALCIFHELCDQFFVFMIIDGFCRLRYFISIKKPGN